jgi:hypothetical protein
MLGRGMTLKVFLPIPLPIIPLPNLSGNVFFTPIDDAGKETSQHGWILGKSDVHKDGHWAGMAIA